MHKGASKRLAEFLDHNWAHVEEKERKGHPRDLASCVVHVDWTRVAESLSLTYMSSGAYMYVYDTPAVMCW